ncbi:MAG TPA: T9SS type A sorting domain-containing protein [Saprospiraceae bacterium]|nr:T9SS type A sorting domain-containing protein [Saprospiraceae bacterium]
MLERFFCFITIIFWFNPIPIYSQEFIDIEFLRNYNRSELAAQVGNIAEYGVDVYKMRYASPDLYGNMDTLSGLVAIPVAQDLLFPLLIYSHGTVSSRFNVPSRLSAESLLPTVLSSTGYIVAAPDLLGLGDSKGIHPYLHAQSSALSSFDMIRAIKEYKEVHGIDVNEQLFITGYSQGGHTTMALHRYIQELNLQEYEITAAAPMSGPYSMSIEMFEFTMGEKEYFFPGYLVAIILSFQEVYRDVFVLPGLEEIFKKEYLSDIEEYLNEVIDLSTLNNRLVTNVRNAHGRVLSKYMINDEIYEEIWTENQHPFRLALADNDVYEWVPKAPTRLIYCRDDDQVVFTNSIRADSVMRALGSQDVFAVNGGNDLDHGQCIPNALTITYLFFRQFQNVKSQSSYPEAQMFAWSTYPNPANSRIILKLEDSTEEGKIYIYDMMGRCVYLGVYITGTEIIVDSLKTGKYVLHFQNENKSITSKFFIVR